ncbi:MAG: MFS transporter [Planctomycetes bacterium]|nr:MFS transporter [Planctomycetota bacterium]
MDMQRDGIAPNAGRLLWAGFFAILAAGIGFGIRSNLGGTWRAEFGFSETDIGAIASAGFPGFCFGIIAGGLVCDLLGYRALIVGAFAMHVVSAVMTFAVGTDNALSMLYWSTFVFGLANGTLEAVANPLVATLFPQHRTHYLNILHASWPAGLVLGGLIVLGFGDSVGWRMQLALFLVPTLFYGALFFAQAMPKSEATRSGLGFLAMFKDVGIAGGLVICLLLSQFFAGSLGFPPGLAYGIAGVLLLGVGIATNFSPGSWMLFALFVLHLMVGAVELGTDSWISGITGNLLTPAQGQILFVFTSAVMFSLRFCAGWIERRGFSPVGILLVSSVLACVGLNMTAGIDSFAVALIALTIYAVGKTFFWPTMLAVASDRFPRTGAVAISLMGGIGMLSAGIVGGPGLGYAKDRFSGEELVAVDPALHARFAPEKPSQWLVFAEVKGIDGKKRSEVEKRLADVRADLARQGIHDSAQAFAKLTEDDRKVVLASMTADRRTLRVDSLIPATMAVAFLLLALWFRSQGGYRVLRIGKNGEVEAAPTGQHGA